MVMHRSRLPLTVWFWAAHLMATHSNGMSAFQFEAQLGITYKTAWLLAQKLRRSMIDPQREPLEGVVEIDQTEIPFRTDNSFFDPATSGKILIAGAVKVIDRGTNQAKPRRKRAKYLDTRSGRGISFAYNARASEWRFPRVFALSVLSWVRRRSPIKVTPPRQQQHVEYRIKELAETASKKLGISRRQFLEGTGGLAASFIAINEAFGSPYFKVSPVEMYEPAAYAEHGTPSDVFVFDDQTHIVRSSVNTPQGLRALAQGPGPVSTGAGFTSNPFNGTGGNPAGVDELGTPWTDWNPAQLGPNSPPNPGPPATALGEFHLGQYINRLYLQAQTSVSIISNANIALFQPSGGTARPAVDRLSD